MWFTALEVAVAYPHPDARSIPLHVSAIIFDGATPPQRENGPWA
jgi:hypothetical protein